MGCRRPTMQGCEVRGPAVDLQLHQVPLELEGGPAGGDAVVATTRTFARSALFRGGPAHIVHVYAEGNGPVGALVE